jgi:5'-nucleotidase / UDP-sugar diphosphatase
MGSSLGETAVEVENGEVVQVESRLITLWTDEYPPDEQFASLVAELRAPYQDKLDEVIATAAAPISRSYRSESPFDKLAGDILRREMEAEIAFLPGVGYGVTLLPGPITREEFYTLIPHPAPVVTLKMTGAQVLEVLEQSVANQKPEKVEEIVGGLVQTAGLRWTVDYDQPVGRRVSQVEVNGESIQPERWYQAATNGGMLSGLHNYTSFSQGRNIKKHDLRLNEVVEAGL